MKLRRLQISDFRNIAQAQLDFEGNRHFFLGMNGQGKTNLLEAIGLARGLQSFRTHLKAPLVRKDTPQATVRTVWEHEIRGQTTLGVSFTTSRRTAVLDGDHVRKVEDVLGLFPVVSLTLADRELIYGGPAARRNEVDNLLCQIHPPYHQTLEDYAEALKARNKILSEGGNTAEREAFEAQMSKSGAIIVRAREKMVAKLQEYLAKVFPKFSPEGESPTLVYEPNVPAESLSEAWKKNLTDELRRGVTLFGPHRDPIDILFNGQLAEDFASEGQKFSIVLALKLAGVQLLEEKLNIAPVLVADDLLLELDASRQEKFWTAVKDWQVFASGTAAPHPLANEAWQIWRVEKGVFTKQ